MSETILFNHSVVLIWDLWLYLLMYEVIIHSLYLEHIIKHCFIFSGKQTILIECDFWNNAREFPELPDNSSHRL